MKNIQNTLAFGEKVKGFNKRVLNEREVRASAGILFAFALVSFMNSWLLGDFYYTKIFVIAFLGDFFIRIFINPRFSPSLIIGRFFVRNQKPEYVGAAQKRFAWALGFTLALIMFYLVILNNMIGPINLLICLTCLLLLFFETAFGICLGCKIYPLFLKKKATLCPGGSCETFEKEEIQKINIVQGIIVFFFLLFIFSISHFMMVRPSQKIALPVQNSEEKTEIFSQEKNDKCIVPDWAIAMGHEEKWKLHNGCK